MKFLVISFLVVAPLISWAQGPWSPGFGHGYAQVMYTFIPSYSELYVGGNETITTERELSDRTLSMYAEAGISDRWSIMANVPIGFVESGDATTEGAVPMDPAGTLSGFGNVSLSGKYTFLQRKIVAALITQVDFNTSSRQSDTGLSTGVDALTLLPKLSVGSSGDKWYAFGYLGYGWRSNDYHDLLLVGAEAGIKLNSKVYAIANFNSWNHLDNGDDGVDSEANLRTGLYTSIQEFNAVLIKILAEDLWRNVGVIASIGGGNGTSVAASPAISLGVFLKW